MDAGGVSMAVSGWILGCVAGAGLLAIAGCATPEAADPRGKWRPLHQFADSPQAIPLQRAYVFQVFPSDQTLKALLTRWSSDAGLGLSYLHADDYTLHAPVAQLRTTGLQEAVSLLSAAYAPQGVQVTAEDAGIVVRPIGIEPAPPASGAGD